MSQAADEFWQRVANSRLLHAEQLAYARTTAAGGDPKALAIWLLKQGLLTRWQAQQLLAGQDRFYFGKYRLLEQLGQGGMGTVYKVQEQHGLNRVLALKIISPKAMQKPDSERRFLREVQVAAALNHPNIVAAYEADQAQGQYYFVMEYVPGKDLGAWIREYGTLPLDWSCECVRQTALGLQHAHEKKLVHRDIKPANVLVVAGESGQPPLVKILDLGLARFVDPEQDDTDLTGTGEVMGTVDFMSPEQARNTKTADIRADVFSLGCTLFKMLTGDVPFPGANVTEKLMARAMQDAVRVRTLRPEVPAKLDALIAKMLARKPEDRFQTPGEVAEALRPFCPGEHEESTRLELHEQTQVTLAPSADEGSEAQGFLAKLSHAAQDATESLDARDHLKLVADRSDSLSPESAVRIRRSLPKSRAGLWVGLGALAVLILLIAGGLYFAFGPQSQQRTVRVFVDQPDAHVQLGFGRNYRSPKTREPLELTLPVGDYTLTVSKSGYQEHRSQVEIKPAAKEKSAEIVRVEVRLLPVGAVATNPPPAFERPNPEVPNPPPLVPTNTPPRISEAVSIPYSGVPAGTVYTNSLGMKFSYIPPGEFTMGSPETEKGRNDDETPHKVVLTKGFYLGVYEVTQEEYQQIMGTNPSDFAATGTINSRVAGLDTRRFPVEKVSWDEAVEFCRKLSAREGKAYRLPTEAEWEYACRAGTATPFHFGMTCNGQEANCQGDNPYGRTAKGPNLERTTVVGQYPPNAWDLYDMHGNVREWCSDWPRDYPSGTVTNPTGPATGATDRVGRGGAWSSYAKDCRSAIRDRFPPGLRRNNQGFRVVLEASPELKPESSSKSTSEPVANVAPGTPYTNSLGMKFSYIPPGEFTMGSPETEKGRNDDETPHKVVLTKGFYLGVYEVTQEEYQQIMGTNPSDFAATGAVGSKVAGLDTQRFPVERVSWDEAVEFCRKLSAREGQTYRLPTEAQWEYACRAGTTTPFHFGTNCNGSQANCRGDLPYGTTLKGPYLGRPSTVGQYPPNAWGLYDLHGNVREWCIDWLRDAPAGTVTNPTDPTSGTSPRIIRGGSWYSGPQDCRSANRNGNAPEFRSGTLGFRVVLEAKPELKPNVVPTPTSSTTTPEPVANAAPGTPYTNSLGMKFSYIPPGEFMMGSPESEERRDAHETQHKVILTQGFYLGVFEVTQAEYQQVMGTNPSTYASTGGSKTAVAGLETQRFPVESVIWNNAVEFCRKLSAQEGKTYRLPTEAEWEYACRAGTTTPFHFGTNCNGSQANCRGDLPYGTTVKGPYLGRPSTVGQYPPNAWGLYDLHGNVREWCADWHSDYPIGPVTNPTGPSSVAKDRVSRGGGWNSSPQECRSAFRDIRPSINVGVALGFRVVLVPSRR